MKKLFILLAVTFFAFSLKAQDAPYYFVLNEDGDGIEISGEIPTDADAAESYSEFRAAIVNWGSAYHVVTIVSDQEDKQLIVDGIRNAKASYNPFSGGFFENVCYKLYLDFSDNNVTYTIKNIDIRYVYNGYGSKQEQTPVVKKIKEMKKAEAGMNNASLSKKERKEHKENFEDTSESLQAAYEALHEYVIDALKAIKF